VKIDRYMNNTNKCNKKQLIRSELDLIA